MRVGLIGGSEGGVSLWGGFSRLQVRLVLVAVGTGVLAMMSGHALQGVAIAVGGGVVGWLLALETESGTLGGWVVTEARWWWRRFHGSDRFVPYTDEGWAAARSRKERMALRARPDGADAMVWLASDVRRPGIAWHKPIGEEEYLSVVFAVEGILQGLESQTEIERASEAWGHFLAGFGGSTSLVRHVQTLTRILPPEMGFHERWVRDNLDTDIDEQQRPTVEALRASYEDVLKRCETGALVQRHFVVLRWPVTAAFAQQARQFGTYHEGWLGLMSYEIDAAARALSAAGMGRAHVLTARQVSALMLHQQDPARPLDRVVDVDPDRTGCPSHDTRTACVVEGIEGPVWHATAVIRSRLTGTGPRTPLWTVPWTTGMRAPIIRSISFHLRLVPSVEARGYAERDAARAQGEVLEAAKRARVDSEEAKHQREIALSRMEDLKPGSRHHGVEWIGYVTISAKSEEDLRRDKRVVEEHAQTGLGITRLVWLDTMQSAAMGTSWPIARGLRPREAPLFDKVSNNLQKV